MKKLIGIIAVISLILVSAACSKDTGSSGETGKGTAAKNTAETKDSAEAASGEPREDTEIEKQINSRPAKLLYMGQGSVRIQTPEGKVIYIDPYCGEGYEPAADLILVTHDHYDHNNVDMIKNRSADCQIITWKEALEGGEHRTFDLDYVTVEAVEAGYNQNHDVSECVGYILTLSDGVSVYLTGDTSKTEQMPKLAEKKIDYAFYCCDGVYNMGPEEAAECAGIVGAKHNIPYHVIAGQGVYYDRQRAEQFNAPNRLIVDQGQEIELTAE